jgi:imidazolonepropionase-like amidohydrolase
MMNVNVRRWIGGLTVVASFALVIGTRAQGPQQSGAVVYEGARLIVGDGKTIENSAFIVESGRISQVGARGQVKAPAGATRVDLAGKTVMPAIVDAHTHMPTERQALAELLQRKAYFGVGAVISLGQDNNDVAFQVREQPIPGAARLRTAGRGITAPEPGRTEAPYWVTSEAEARKAVQELAARTVDMVKIWVDDRDAKYKKLTPELYGAIIDEAHKQKLRVTAHIVTLEDAKGLLRAGLDGFAHTVRDRDIDDEFVGLVKQRKNLFYVPNLPDRGVKTDMSWLSTSMTPEELKKVQEGASTDRAPLQQAFGIQARNLARMNKEGALVAMGTDGGVPWSHHVEMADMVAAGMTPAQVITAATRNAAQVLRLDDMGTVAPGKSADFIVLDANPLEDITNTRKISSVYLRGAAIDRAAIRARMTGGKT